MLSTLQKIKLLTFSSGSNDSRIDYFNRPIFKYILNVKSIIPRIGNRLDSSHFQFSSISSLLSETAIAKSIKKYK